MAQLSIKAVIFDCFGVLYRDPSLNFYERNIKNYEDLREQIQQIDNQFDSGFIDEADHSMAVADISSLDTDFIEQNIRREHSRNNELIDYMTCLRRDYKIGMLSNIGKGGMEPFFSGEQQRELFDEVLLSSDVGIIKPNPEVFKIIAERLAVKPEECVMIDDRASNCVGAESASMKTILFESNEQLKADIRYLIL